MLGAEESEEMVSKVLEEVFRAAPENPVGSLDEQTNDSGNQANNPSSANQSESHPTDGTLKPVGFVNYGTFDATVRP